MENEVVSQLIGDVLRGLQCLLFASWLPDATMKCVCTGRRVRQLCAECRGSFGDIRRRSEMCHRYSTAEICAGGDRSSFHFLLTEVSMGARAYVGLTVKPGLVGPMEHCGEVFQGGCSVAF